MAHFCCPCSAQDTVFYGINYMFRCLNECIGCNIFNLFVASIITTLPIMIEKYMIKNHLENNELVTGCF